ERHVVQVEEPLRVADLHAEVTAVEYLHHLLEKTQRVSRVLRLGDFTVALELLQLGGSVAEVGSTHSLRAQEGLSVLDDPVRPEVAVLVELVVEPKQLCDGRVRLEYETQKLADLVLG